MESKLGCLLAKDVGLEFEMEHFLKPSWTSGFETLGTP